MRTDINMKVDVLMAAADMHCSHPIAAHNN
jgi:hypothetical protein